MENVFLKRILKFRKLYPNKIAFNYLNQGVIESSITYNQIFNDYNLYKEYLDNLKINNKLYILYLSASVDFISILLSCISSNVKVIVRTIGSTVSIEKLNRQLEDLQNEIPNIEGVITNFDYPNFEQICLKTNLNFINIKKKYENLFISKSTLDIEDNLILLTSGSTKISKGVLINLRGLELNIKECINFWNITENDICLNWMPHSHIYGLITGFLLPIYTGSSCYIMSPKEYSNNFNLYLENIYNYNITHTHTPASNDFLEKGFRFLNNVNSSFSFSSLRVISLGGEAINNGLLQRFYYKAKEYSFNELCFSPNYGMSEITGLLCAIRSDEKLRIINLKDFDLNNSNIKNILKNCEFYQLVSVGNIKNKAEICEPNSFKRLEDLKLGEIVINVSSISNGYINPADNDVFIKKGSKNYYRTGDLGFTYNDYLIVAGRLKEIIKINGKNISPYEIENLIISNLKKDIKNVVAFSKKNNDSITEEIGIFIEMDKKFNKDLILKEICNLIYKNMQIKIKEENILFLIKNVIPRFTNGKISRKKCNDLFNIYKEEENEKN